MHLQKQFEATFLIDPQFHPGNIPAGMAEIFHHTSSQRICDHPEHDRDDRALHDSVGRDAGRRTGREHEVDTGSDEVLEFPVEIVTDPRFARVAYVTLVPSM